MQRRFRFSLLCFSLFILLLSGCEKSSPPTTPPSADAPAATQSKAPAPVAEETAVAGADAEVVTTKILQAPISAQLRESDLGALPLWRPYRLERPALVLMTQEPLLWPLPEGAEDEIVAQITALGDEELQRLCSDNSVEPPLFAPSVADATLRAGWFRELVWVIPTSYSAEELSLEVMRQQLLERGFLTQAEAAGLERSDYGFRGMVRGLPFQAVHPSTLPPLNGSVLFHFGVDFFRELYKGEIKTPLYPLLREMMFEVRKAAWDVVAVTVAQGNLGGTLPLATRFLGPDVVGLMAHPQWLETIPSAWDRRGRALYLDNFFQNDEIFRLYQEMLKEAPEDPSVHYALYQRYRQRKEIANAMPSLAEAVRLDPVYGLEYLELASLALERKAHGKDLEMLQLAAEAMPDNPWLRIELAKSWLSLGNEGKSHAIPLLQELKALPWSARYFADIPPLVEAMLKVAESGEEATQ